MDALILARAQFAANMSFHILFPTISIALGWTLLFMRWRWLSTKDAAWLEAYRFWTKVFALTFALVAIAWIPFRANNFSDTWYIFSHLTAGASGWLDLGKDSIQFRGMGLNGLELTYCVAFVGLVILYDFFDSHRNVWEFYFLYKNYNQ